MSSGWQRLHPLSPVIRAGRVLVPVVLLLAASAAHPGGGGDSLPFESALVAVTVIVGVIHWLVTRWRLEGATLQIESGLLRRDSRQLPVARIQAVDVIQPLLARIFGLAELRIRLAGSTSASGKLAYLSEPVALDLRARLLAGHHGLDPSTPEPGERVVASVPTGRLVGSVALSASTLGSVVLLVAVLVASHISKAAVVALGGSLVIYVLGLVRSIWRLVSTQYGFTVAEAPDGIRIRRGLLGTVAETIPIRRVQAVRLVEPLLWRAFGWCRLEVDIAGSAGRDQGPRSGTVTKALLPVGPESLARHLLQTVITAPSPALERPPAQARWKAPLSYHFLAAGHDDAVAMSVTGRVRKVTCWVPLEKVQSVRRIQGPVQRALGLASVHVDAAGRRVRAEFRDRGTAEADALLEAIATSSRYARRRESLQVKTPVGARVANGAAVVNGTAVPAVAPPGWYPDPAARHQLRYFDQGQWTAHVADDGASGVDPL